MRFAVILLLLVCASSPAQTSHRRRHPRHGTRESYLWTAACKDGTHTFSKPGHGACSHHGGVKVWLKR